MATRPHTTLAGKRFPSGWRSFAPRYAVNQLYLACSLFAELESGPWQTTLCRSSLRDRGRTSACRGSISCTCGRKQKQCICTCIRPNVAVVLSLNTPQNTYDGGKINIAKTQGTQPTSKWSGATSTLNCVRSPVDMTTGISKSIMGSLEHENGSIAA